MSRRRPGSSVAVPGLDALTSKAKLLQSRRRAENGGGTFGPHQRHVGRRGTVAERDRAHRAAQRGDSGGTATGWPTATGPASPGVVTLTASEVPLVVVVVVATRPARQARSRTPGADYVPVVVAEGRNVPRLERCVIGRHSAELDRATGGVIGRSVAARKPLDEPPPTPTLRARSLLATSSVDVYVARHGSEMCPKSTLLVPVPRRRPSP